MIYELRTYTLIPGKQAEYLQLSRDIGRKVRGDKYGKFEGAWTTEFGPLRQALAKDDAWTKEYLPKIRPLMLAQENKILYAVDGVPFTAPIGGDRHVYELRTYRTPVGKVPEWLGHFKGVLPTREKYSKIVGFWATELAQSNQMFLLRRSQ